MSKSNTVWVVREQGMTSIKPYRIEIVECELRDGGAYTWNEENECEEMWYKYYKRRSNAEKAAKRIMLKFLKYTSSIMGPDFDPIITIDTE